MNDFSNFDKDKYSKPKREKIPIACNNCRIKKIKCSGAEKCSKCVKLNIDCVYSKDRKYIINSTKNIIKKPKQNKSIQKEKSTKITNLKNDNGNLINSINHNNQFPILNNIFPLNQSHKNLDDTNMANYQQQQRQEQADFDTNIGKNIQNTKKSYTSFQALGLAQMPPKEKAFDYMQTTWNIACISFRFYHRPTVYKLLESVYEIKEKGIDIDDLNNFNFEQRKALPLFYLIFACGFLFINEQKAKEGNNILEFFTRQEQSENFGLDYFESGKKLLDFINGSDNRTIQTLFMMSLYCQFTARLSESYTYNSLAITAVLKKSYYKKQLGNTAQYKDPLQGEVIKRMFWSCYKTEIYMSTILGHPIKLKLKDITQDFPMDTEDENISNTHITLNTDNEIISSCGINNFHTKLMLIMYEIKEHYQDLANQQIRENKMDNNALLPSDDFIVKMETTLASWISSLPDYLKPSVRSNFIPNSFLRINKLLHLDYLNVKLMLYKPFTQIDFENEATLYQKVCVDTCVEVIHLAEMMWSKNILTGTYWFSQYTIFFALALLTSWKMKCGDNFDDLLELNRSHGLELLMKLKECSVTSMFIYNELKTLFKIENDSNNVLSEEEDDDDHVVEPKQLKTPLNNVTSNNESLTAFNSVDENNLFEGMPFFEAAGETPFDSKNLIANSIFEQFNDLF